MIGSGLSPPSILTCQSQFGHVQSTNVIVVAYGSRGSSRWAPFSHDRPRISYGREPFVGHAGDHKERRGHRWPLLESRPSLAKNSVANDRDGGCRSLLHLLRSEDHDSFLDLAIHRIRESCLEPSDVIAIREVLGLIESPLPVP